MEQLLLRSGWSGANGAAVFRGHIEQFCCSTGSNCLPRQMERSTWSSSFLGAYTGAQLEHTEQLLSEYIQKSTWASCFSVLRSTWSGAYGAAGSPKRVPRESKCYIVLCCFCSEMGTAPRALESRCSMFPLEFRADVNRQETRVIVLSSNENRMIVDGGVLTWYQRVTDGRTDGQTESIIANTALCIPTGHIYDKLLNDDDTIRFDTTQYNVIQDR